MIDRPRFLTFPPFFYSLLMQQGILTGPTEKIGLTAYFRLISQRISVRIRLISRLVAKGK